MTKLSVVALSIVSSPTIGLKNDLRFGPIQKVSQKVMFLAVELF